MLFTEFLRSFTEYDKVTKTSRSCTGDTSKYLRVLSRVILIVLVHTKDELCVTDSLGV